MTRNYKLFYTDKRMSKFSRMNSVNSIGKLPIRGDLGEYHINLNYLLLGIYSEIPGDKYQ